MVVVCVRYDAPRAVVADPNPAMDRPNRIIHHTSAKKLTAYITLPNKFRPRPPIKRSLKVAVQSLRYPIIGVPSSAKSSYAAKTIPYALAGP
jgi:hypothetical protein